jgi:LEA14-like dessication related protein
MTSPSKLWPLLAVLALTISVPTLPGCWASQAVAQRKAIEQARFSLRNVQLLGLDLVGANLLVTIQLENPTDIEMVLDRLDYTLYVNGLKAFDGDVAQKLQVPPGQARPLPINVTLAYADIGSQIRGLVAAGQVKTWGVKGAAHFDTPVGTIDYPIQLERTL